MQNGFIDRSAGSFVPKHTLEGAFVRHAWDKLLLCQGSEDERQAGKMFTHLPMPFTIGAGFIMPANRREIRVPRPHHAFQLKLDGQTFPFVVTFSALDDRTLGFAAV